MNVDSFLTGFHGANAVSLKIQSFDTLLIQQTKQKKNKQTKTLKLDQIRRGIINYCLQLFSCFCRSCCDSSGNLKLVINDESRK